MNLPSVHFVTATFNIIAPMAGTGLPNTTFIAETIRKALIEATSHNSAISEVSVTAVEVPVVLAPGARQ